MITIGKKFLIAVFTLALFAFSQPVLAETAAKADANGDVKTEAPAKVDAKPDTKTPVPEKSKEMLEAEAKAKTMMEKATRKIDIKNLPKDITNLLPFDGETFAVSVGETKPIAAARQTKCLSKEAPPWENTKPRLPPTGLVTFSDGGSYERMSDRCGGVVPARAVFATGVKVGSERVVIFGQTITVVVK